MKKKQFVGHQLCQCIWHAKYQAKNDMRLEKHMNRKLHRSFTKINFVRFRSKLWTIWNSFQRSTHIRFHFIIQERIGWHWCCLSLLLGAVVPATKSSGDRFLLFCACLSLLFHCFRHCFYKFFCHNFDIVSDVNYSV